MCFESAALIRGAAVRVEPRVWADLTFLSSATHCRIPTRPPSFFNWFSCSFSLILIVIVCTSSRQCVCHVGRVRENEIAARGKANKLRGSLELNSSSPADSLPFDTHKLDREFQRPRCRQQTRPFFFSFFLFLLTISQFNNSTQQQHILMN